MPRRSRARESTGRERHWHHCRGIGPAYEDRRRGALRVADLFHRERFAAKLEILDYHNFILQRYYQTA